METKIPMETQKTYADPTKPVIPPAKRKLNISWILFIGFNIAIPVLFLGTYLWMKNS